jgi:cytochrome c oxidase assembly protein Cox11
LKVFFYIDKDILEDATMDHVNNITLSYTFFKTGEDSPDEDAVKTTAVIAK